MMRHSAIFLLLFLAACGGNATAPKLADGKLQTIRIDTPGMSGARCVAQSGAATYTTLTPGTVAVQPAATAMTVSCFKGDYMLGHALVTPLFSSREAQAATAHGRACETCHYPAMINVAMGLNTDVADDITVRQIR